MHLERRKLRRIAETEVDRLRADLPREIRALAERVPVHLPALPDAETARELGDDLLGLFSGETHAENGATLMPTPPQIHLYLGNLWSEAEENTDRFREEVRVTYLHELGHYLGWDEDAIDARGLH